MDLVDHLDVNKITTTTTTTTTIKNKEKINLHIIGCLNGMPLCIFHTQA